MSLATRLIYARRGPFKRIVKELLALTGIEFPADVEVGSELIVAHRGFGLVVHPKTTLGKHVILYQGVTLGSAAPWDGPRAVVGIEVGDDVTICAGAKVLAPSGELLRIGKGTIIAANAVLTRSTGEDELWAGIPARLIKKLEPGTGRGHATSRIDAENAAGDPLEVETA